MINVGLPALSTFYAYDQSFFTFITLAVNRKKNIVFSHLVELPQLVNRKTIRVYGEAFRFINFVQRGFSK